MLLMLLVQEAPSRGKEVEYAGCVKHLRPLFLPRSLIIIVAHVWDLPNCGWWQLLFLSCLPLPPFVFLSNAVSPPHFFCFPVLGSLCCANLFVLRCFMKQCRLSSVCIIVSLSAMFGVCTFSYSMSFKMAIMLTFVTVELQGMCSIPFVFLLPQVLWLLCCNIKILPPIVCISDVYINQVIHFYSLPKTYLYLLSSMCVLVRHPHENRTSFHLY